MRSKNFNPNYCATVVRIHNLIDCEGLDNLKALPLFGYSALVGKDYQVGEIGLLFVAETKLSQDFMHHNNLNRDKSLNKDINKVGYVEKRIKPLKLKGNISTALFIRLDCLSYLDIDASNLKEGDTFTHINNIEICSKYIIRQPNSGKKNKQRSETKKIVVDENIFKQHIETEHFLRNLKHFKPDDMIVVTEKIHSTSGRFGKVLVDKKLSKLQKIAKFLGFNVVDKEWKSIAGSRRVVKYNDASESFYSNDVWNIELQKFAHLIPKNVIIYTEIVGWDGESKLQKDYSYQMPVGTTQSYVYRIASVNEDGFMVDWGWDQIKYWCDSVGMKHVPEVFYGRFKDFDYTIYENKKFNEDLGLSQCLPLDEGAPCSEGLVIRKIDGNPVPYLTKYKSPEFYLHEGNEINCGRVDMETQENELELVDTE